MLQSIIFNWNVLILMEKIVNFELQLGDWDIFSAVVIFQSNEFILEFNPHFPFVVQIVFQFILIFLEFLSLILEHKLKFSHIMVLERV